MSLSSWAAAVFASNDVTGTSASVTHALWVDAGLSRFDGDVQVNTDTFYVDVVNGKVGIGTDTPHADGFGGRELVISDPSAASAGISVQSGTSLEVQGSSSRLSLRHILYLTCIVDGDDD